MSILAHKLFDLPDSTWKEANIAKEANTSLASLLDKNPFLDPYKCKHWIESLAMISNHDFTYGGYLENRVLLWRGSYLKKDHAYHLGVDYNVPAGTEVFFPWNAEVIEWELNKDQECGWGGRLIVKTGDVYAIFGHINAYWDVKPGCKFNAGRILGVVSNIDQNGGWYPHLHLQYMSASCFEKYRDKTEQIDGYGEKYIGCSLDYPNPEFYI